MYFLFLRLYVRIQLSQGKGTKNKKEITIMKKSSLLKEFYESFSRREKI